ncbi:sacsin N-terminal ATP-binding-like domain-containing protein [Streptomyces violens]|uniref:sacsin N-terminal ATP-binding-like domain-containing protein n=1 Tax=Streptomyces violens TaxID=66377 RepID=UPI0004C06F7B|nr:DEAD/DEAH box helicase family protein [Streptomyces violens]
MNSHADSAVLSKIAELTELALGTYAFNPDRVEEDANGERRIHQGGYGDRQLFELVQNAADELREQPRGKIHVILDDDHLYCANEGTPITPEGADTILRMGVSRKRGGQIGRFGVGVKSVLSVTPTPQFFSTSGSFGFDADWSAAEILAAVNKGRAERGLPPVESVGETPVLRLARPLDVEQECARDGRLRELLSWATTVVRLPLLPGAADRLALDIQQLGKGRNDGGREEFPRLFQLFSHHVGTVLLEDVRKMPKVRRELTVEHDGIFHTVREARGGAHAEVERFRVFTMPHSVTDESRGTAGELHARVTIDVSWAVPEYKVNEQGIRQVPNERGWFWSFFPTRYATTLSGALNAAWKTNEDRQNLLTGSNLNEELIRVAADLVVGALPDLVEPEDPAAYLPLLPGRTKESPNWACARLTELVWKSTAQKPSLPDQDGALRIPAELRIHPERLPKEALALWSSYPGRPRDWVHHSVEVGGRRGKLTHFLAAADKQEETVRDWLEALVEDGTPEASATAIRLLALLLDKLPAHEAEEARRARIVLTAGHGFVAPVAGRVFRDSGADGLPDDLVYVDERISSDAALLSHLDRLGIRDADSRGRFQSVLDQGFDGYTDESWTRFWELLRSAGGTAQVLTIRAKVPHMEETLRVRTIAGAFRPLKECLLPGMVVPANGSRDAEMAVDMSFHDASVLRELGMKDRPTRGHHPEQEAWFEGYHRAQHDAYLESLDKKAGRVQMQTVQLEGSPTAGPLHLFEHLSPEGKAAFVDAVPADGIVESWTRQIGRNVSTRTRVESPIRWLLRRTGMVHTSKGLVPLHAAVGPQLSAYAHVLPVATKLDEDKARRLGLPTSVHDVAPERWSALLDLVKTSEDDALVGSTYATLIRVALELVEAEETVRCRVGDEWEMRPDSDIAVATTRAGYDELVREKHPVLLVDAEHDREQAEYMITQWGMRRVSDVVEKRVRAVPVGPAVPLVDEYPPLRQRLGNRANGLSLQRCSELEEVVRTPKGSWNTPLDGTRQEHTVLVPDELSAEEALVIADREFGWNMGVAGCRALMQKYEADKADRAYQARLTAIRRSQSVIDKIAMMIDEESLKTELPAGLLASEVSETGQEPDARRLAEMAYNAHGESVLRVHAKDIATQYTNAPRHFDGGSSALRFVTDLGFPDSFAGARVPSPPARMEAQGPTEFPALHPYQERLASKLTQLLTLSTPQRAMLSLPTGAGKTRVTAEGVIRWIREAGTPRGPILWMAQTEELCEQAVQSWKFVWEKVGADQPLVIDRLWSSNSATPVSDRPHLVVATDAKLRVCLHTDEYAWLRGASLVLADEAHVAIGRRYTEILEQLGLTHRETPRHLVGLTATPFRNDADLTRRLAQRFGNHRLDENVFVGEPIPSLQDLGVLAQVVHRELAGARVQLNADELRTVEQFNGFLPKGAEQRLAEDEARNQMLLDEITAMPDDWPVLVFATSVSHAKFLAAKLGDRGIRAAAIDSATPTTERRQRVDAFRRGEIRVITNYGVLTQGFDAPATRAVVIARPVYSANSYQQMIGRGLRGPRNGGKDTCLILDVRDNVVNHDESLAFTKFEYLWKKGEQ